MLLPLFILAFGAVFSGWFFKDMFVGFNWDYFWSNSIFILTGNDAIYKAHSVPKWVKLLPIVLAIIGISIATVFYVLIPDLPSRVSKAFRVLYALFYNKWYFDEFINFIIVKPVLRLGKIFWKWGDGFIIDGLINRLALNLIPTFTNFYAKLQSGFLFHYAFAMIIGITFFITWFSF